MRTRKQNTRLFAGLTTAAVLGGCIGYGNRDCILPDLRVSAAASAHLQMGDINFDGYLDADDATGILSHYLSLVMDTPTNRLQALQLPLADIDHNDLIDADDATLVLYRYVCELTQTPCTWEMYAESYPLGLDPNRDAGTAVFGDLKLTLGADTGVADVLLGEPAEVLTEGYQDYMLEYRVYHADAEDLTIVMADAGKIVGAYVMTSEWSYPTTACPYLEDCSDAETWLEYVYPDEVTVTEFRDGYSASGMYAVMVMQEGYTAKFADQSDPGEDSAASRISYYLTNALRAKHGIHTLQWDDTVAEVARKHSEDMAVHGFIGHTGSDGSSSSERLDAAGVDHCYQKENVSEGYPSVFQVVCGWYNSNTGHRDNILNTAVYRIGAGFAWCTGKTEKAYGTQDFFALFDDYSL